MAVPGQEIGTRYEAVRRTFEGKQPVAGVLHVAASGYASIRSKPARAAIQHQFKLESIQQYRQHMLAEEIADLRRTCSFIKRTVLKHHKPVWMIVAATKCDLYKDELDAVENYYSPYGRNEFVKELNDLTEAIGSLHFSWDSVPVCATLEDMEWNGQVVTSNLKPSQRDQLITQLLQRVERNCGQA